MTLHAVPIDARPTSMEELVALRDRIAGTPEGGAAVFVVALLLYADSPPLGVQALTLAVDRGRLRESPDGYRGFSLQPGDLKLIERQLAGRAYLARSYLAGTSPGASYAAPPLPWTINVATTPTSGDPATGVVKLFIPSSGADSPRPITLRRNERGLWKASEWSSLVVGIRPPAPAPDPL
jgi:hypothetical protein